MRFITIITLATLLSPVCSFAASREQQEMQRDIAQLQDQVRTLQSGFDQKMAALQTLVQQALDAGNKANVNMGVLNASISQTLDRELRDKLTPVAGLAAKVDNLSNDDAELRNSIGDLSAQVNKILQLLTDVNNAVKIIQAPPVAPPPAAGSFPGGAAQSSSAPPPAGVIYGAARGDYSSGKSDLAASEFAEFLKDYPDDAYAPDAQLTIGQIHYSQGKYDPAVADFDAVLERYPDSKITPTAYFMKGMALRAGDHKDKAIAEFRALIKKFPNSDDAKSAREQLKMLGVSQAAPAPAVRRRPQ
ncbi:MAG TPA: tetratricopeptide repeat protein [Bryobacteraceae bacterium]|jgi:tol-pal system protein YbgF|nr:tetratricopeptide repeat protein [Bryobacteraceae bacterium]